MRNDLNVDWLRLKFKLKQFKKQWAVVVAQFVERLLPLPEVNGSNADIDEYFN